jgi:putative hemolysin
MRQYRRIALFTLLLALASIIAACGPLQQLSGTADEEPVPADAEEPGQVGMPNPAAVYCEGLGYTLEARETEGGEDAACIFPDGSECPQWDFLGGRCGQTWTYCAQQGYVPGDTGSNVATCTFPDGSSCPEIDFFNGECAPVRADEEAAAPDESGEEGEAAEPVEAVEPDVTFEGVSFAYDDSVASSATGEVYPAEAFMGGDNTTPEHVLFTFEGYPLADTFHQPLLHVYPVAEFEASSAVAADAVAGLRDLLAAPPADPMAADYGPAGIPFLPLFNAGQIFRTQIEFLDFQNGSGVRFLTQYAQAFNPINNQELFYTFQGLTDDGAYYVAAIFPVSNPGLPADNSGLTEENFDAFVEGYEEYIDDITSNLNAQDPASFTPGLDSLDALVQSLQVE